MAVEDPAASPPETGRAAAEAAMSTGDDREVACGGRRGSRELPWLRGSREERHREDDDKEKERVNEGMDGSGPLIEDLMV
jgi:hypothetical protein